MAQIDLKYATVKFQDGDGEDTTIDNSGGYAIGTSTLTVAALSAAPAEGVVVEIGEHNYITASGSTTTSLVLASGLVAAVADGATVYVYNGVNELEIKIGEGNLTFSESRNIEYTLDRGILDEVREGDQVPMAVSLDFTWEYLTGGSASGAVGTPEDFLKKRGVYSSNVSTDADACRPYAINIVVDYVPDCSTVTDSSEIIVLADFRWESLDHDLSAGTISISGNCNVTEAVSHRY